MRYVVIMFRNKVSTKSILVNWGLNARESNILGCTNDQFLLRGYRKTHFSFYQISFDHQENMNYPSYCQHIYDSSTTVDCYLSLVVVKHIFPGQFSPLMCVIVVFDTTQVVRNIHDNVSCLHK